MTTVRVLAEDDIPAVAALFMRVYSDHGWATQEACESYFRETLFCNPWRDLAIPSWVAEEDGRVHACYAVLPRLMRFQGRTIRVAAGCQFIVDSGERDGFAWVQLAKACLSGPQDLTLADGASEVSQRMWTAIGGTPSLLYSLHWTRPLRPARYALSLLEKRNATAAVVAFAGRPLARPADALVARMHPNGFSRPDPEITEEELDPAEMLNHQAEVLEGVSLQPAYEARSLRWLLDQAARKTRHGALRARAVRGTGLRLIGWYLYYVSAGQAAEVVQIAARNKAYDRVLGSLLADAWRQGATALRGRLDPRHVQELSNHHCWFRREGTWTLAHSRHTELTAAIERGDAFLSRLEGEWFLRFLGG